VEYHVDHFFFLTIGRSYHTTSVGSSDSRGVMDMAGFVNSVHLQGARFSHLAEALTRLTAEGPMPKERLMDGALSLRTSSMRCAHLKKLARGGRGLPTQGTRGISWKVPPPSPAGSSAARDPRVGPVRRRRSDVSRGRTMVPTTS
jgi:hypothetical protein